MDTLEKKTKAQLLDIIDRKDRIERELRDVNKTLNDKIEALNNKVKSYAQLNEDTNKRYNNLKSDLEGTEKELNNLRKTHDNLLNSWDNKSKDYDVLKEDYQFICDVLATERIGYKNKLRKCKIITILIIIAVIIMIFINVV